MTPFPPAHPSQLGEFFDARLQVLASVHRNYRAAARRFLAFLQTHFTEVHCLSDLHRDPHMLGWFRSLAAEDPPLSNSTRRIYLIVLRRLLHDPVSEDHALHPALIQREDFPLRPTRPRKPRPKQNRRSPLPHSIFADIFETHLQTLTATLQPITIAGYRVVARDFLLYLQNHFPQLHQLADLRCDPHWLGWLRSLAEHQPSFCEITRQKYRLKLRALFQQLASRGLLLQEEVLLIEDSPSPLRRTRHQLPHPTLGKIFETQIQTLATTLRPNTIHGYQHATRRFLSFLQTHFPQLQQISDLRRDPHWLAWLRSLHEQNPPLSNATRQGYLLDLRRLLNDLASQGHSLPPELIVPEDFPPRPQYLPRALSPEDDHRLQQELRRRDDLLSQALLLTRATGIRIGECIDLAVDCLRLLAKDQWALHVPLGKLHTERLVPVDDDVRQMVSRILTLRDQSTYSKLANAASFLLPRPYSSARVYQTLRYALSQAAQQAGCSRHVNCHRLRHTYATEMIRLGVSLPALMQLLGHKDIRMTLRYVQVTQQDLQREYHSACRNAAISQLTSVLQLPSARPSTVPDVTGILQAIATTNHLVEMYRRQFSDELTNKKLRRLAQRLFNVASDLSRLTKAEK